jgi:hypothetical protein
VSVCGFCGSELRPVARRPLSASALAAGLRTNKGGGRPRRFCGDRCRKAAARRRAAGLAENALPDGGRRGRVALGERTRAEWRAYYRQVVAELEAAKAELGGDTGKAPTA